MTSDIDKKEIESILIIRLSAIGDVIRVLPSLGLLRKRFPMAKISWVVEEAASDILGGMGEIDEIIVFPKKRILRKLGRPWTFFGAVGEFVKFSKELRRSSFDVALDYHGLLKSGLISFFSGAPVRLGFAKGFSKELNHLFNNRKIKLPVPKLSRITRNLLLTEGLTGVDGVPEIHIGTTPEDRKVVDIIEAEYLSGERPRIVVHPSTSPRTPYKRWGAERYAALSDILVSRLKAEVIITFGPGEEDTAREVRDGMKHGATILDRPMRLRELAELYRRSDVYVGGDTGPMHIASFVGTPVVAIFGPTDPIENEPYVKTPFVMIRRPTDCSPCRKKGCTRGDCFEGITPEEVADEVIRLLGGYRKAIAYGI
ncbi:MAG: glycosyltransferase family 9 protein [Deltaproteobacteria bacterium]|uniref:Glycosyltransferase family 9 protein n=1 Tax=Candidatus Zymogenus saltonus TaxID=2844893 RepID=A0A9D8KAL6_9DELT|nr:glycosyltransferase family 9 protein [Candidatus Zymogenus saltonus]